MPRLMLRCRVAGLAGPWDALWPLPVSGVPQPGRPVQQEKRRLHVPGSGSAVPPRDGRPAPAQDGDSRWVGRAERKCTNNPLENDFLCRIKCVPTASEHFDCVTHEFATRLK